MAGVAPNGNIWLLRGVPIDMAHTKTYRPKSAADQFTAFSGYTKHTLTEQTYIRHSINSIRVEYSADDVIDCNYMIFQNSAFSGKYFYAFITDVEYVSNNTCRIVFDIDNLQTYYFDIAFLPSIIDREHSKTDNIGDSTTADYYIGKNTVAGLPESIGAGIIPNNELNEFVIVIVTTKLLSNPSSPLVRWYYPTGVIRGYMRSACVSFIRVTGLSTEELTAVDNMLNSYIANNGDGINGIIDIFCVPQIFLHDYSFSGSYIENVEDKITTIEVPIETISPNSTLDGYKPKNKKLLTAPYTYGIITSPTGDTKTIAYEQWKHYRSSSSPAYFSYVTVEASLLSGLADYRITLKDYAGDEYARKNSLAVQNFPQVPINTNMFYQWYSQNKNSFLAATIATTISAVANGLTQNASGLLSMFTSQIETVGKLADLNNQSTSLNSASSAAAVWAYPEHRFTLKQMSIDAESAKIVDDYFTKYGYASGELKTPNFWNATGRTKYNYCKTQEANIKSKSATTGVPMAALSDIVNIFNNGVCLWETISDVGNYGENPVRE